MPTRHLFLVIILTCFLTFSSASVYIEEEMVERSPEDVTELLGSTFARLARSGTILVDQRPPPEPKSWELERPDTADDLRRRNTDNSNSSSNSTTRSSSTSTLAPTSTSSGLVVATTESASALPTPFDTGFNNNITTNCQSFMTSMLANSTFKSCLPFSLLLQNSNSFFQASKSLVRITQTLDYSCSANVTTCSAAMAAYAANITSTSACASDLSSQNPTIQQARLGLLAYRTLYSASCLRNPSTSAYCFADAITNSSSPTDSYIYFLPLNISLVGGSQPTCDSCLKNTMSVFEAASSDRSSALASDYVSAAMQVNVNCGPNFVNQSLAAAAASGSPSSMSAGPSWGLFALVLLVASWLL
ncbi:uncharacterized protein PAC_18395 [Phialocephala subalpina]|uniref:DUF7729 domain-containing protein n=1 Tax=Phialocephala subalpina TaxID=576137 RepID=A0A1L7XTY2_9HELO|nr:uncharacterized protein PAC_18395 [Phialocephala subalpina]